MPPTENDPDSLKKEMGDLDTTTPEESKVSSAKKKAKTPAKTAGKKKSAAADPNVVTLAELAKEVGLKPPVARRKLRAAGLEPEGRWKWDKDSGALTKARKVLEKEDATEE